tara:strand:+ start:476 stop:1141 length:666 start_codon:yes stop_codon:yes gene_type:complete
MTLEERIRNKVSGLKQAQTERKIREGFDVTIGTDAGEAFKTRYGGVTLDPYTGKAYHNAGDYVYSADDLQSAMDARNTTNRMSGSIFDYVFDKTGNPNMARHAVNAASYSPGLGTAMGLEDAYQAAREIPDDYQAGDRGAMAANTGLAVMGLGDAALTMVPFAKPIFNAMKRAPKNIGRAGRALERGMFALDDMMTPTVSNRKPQSKLMQELERYLESVGN